MFKSLFPLLSVFLLLGACATTPPPMTAQQIIELNDAALCSLSKSQPDLRFNQEVIDRKLDCSHEALVRNAQGDTQAKKKAARIKRRANPDLYHCLDSGFKKGTEAMAICMAGRKQERQQQELARQQQLLIEQQAAQQRSEALMKLGTELLKPPSEPEMKTTNCHVFGNTMNCTTW